MKVLSIRQPWAWAIIYANKDIENRTQRRMFRGDFYVHATKWGNSSEFDAACEFIHSNSGLYVPSRSQLLIGGIIGVSHITDCVDYHESTWFEGPWGLVLDQEKTREVEFIPCKGQRNFWDYND